MPIILLTISEFTQELSVLIREIRVHLLIF